MDYCPVPKRPTRRVSGTSAGWRFLLCIWCDFNVSQQLQTSEFYHVCPPVASSASRSTQITDQTGLEAPVRPLGTGVNVQDVSLGLHNGAPFTGRWEGEGGGGEAEEEEEASASLSLHLSITSPRVATEAPPTSTCQSTG